VVDDEREILDELSGLLSRRGHTVVCVDGAMTAIRTLDEDGPFDVLLTDIRMPDGSGLDVVRAALAIEPGIASYVMSGHAGPEEISQARDDGALDYFPKPVAFRALMEVLASLSAKRELRPANDSTAPARKASPRRRSA
jgi:DNA-binding NtrC family response regulator